MNKLLNALFIVLLAALGAGGVLFADKNCAKKQADLQQKINKSVAQYVENNSPTILEKMAKTENFGAVIKNFSTVGEDEINNRIADYIRNNPAVLEGYIRNNASFIAATVLDTEEYRNAVKNFQNESNDQTENVNADENQKFRDHWEEMRNNEAAPFIGPKDAPIAVVEFFDFACGHCKHLAPVMEQLIQNNPDVKFVFMPLSFISEYSNYAAKAAVAAAKKGKYMEVSGGIMTLPEMNEETINQILTDAGLEVAEIKTLLEEKEVRRGLQDIDKLSQLLDINGVPMILINGEPFYGRTFGDLQNKLNSYK